MKKMRVTTMVLCALFASLSVVLSQISIPIGPVPINLTHVSIFTSSGLLGAKYGAVSQIIFVLMGASGLPVFSGFTGGMGIVFGPTGGFIIGYIGCAFIMGFIIERFGTSMKVLFIAMYSGWIVTYVFGILWFMYSMKMALIPALSYCVFPFLLGDILKTILSATLINRLNPLLRNKNNS